MPHLKRIITHPAVYVAWATFVVLSLLTTYAVDPYVFGFCAMILGGTSMVFIAAGITGMVSLQASGGGARTLIICSLVVVAAALLLAFVALDQFKWA